MPSFTCYDVEFFRPNQGVRLTSGQKFEIVDLDEDEINFIKIWMSGGDQKFSGRYEISEWEEYLSNLDIDITQYKGENGFWKQYKRKASPYKKKEAKMEDKDDYDIESLISSFSDLSISSSSTEKSETSSVLVDSSKVITPATTFHSLMTNLASLGFPPVEFERILVAFQSINVDWNEEFVRVSDLPKIEPPKSKKQKTPEQRKKEHMNRMRKSLDKDPQFDETSIGELLEHAEKTIELTEQGQDLDLYNVESCDEKSDPSEIINVVNKTVKRLAVIDNLGLQAVYYIGKYVHLYREITQKTWGEIDQDQLFEW